MIELVNTLVDTLNNNFGSKTNRYYIHETPRYFKVFKIVKDLHKLYGFVSKENFESTATGKIVPGDILRPRRHQTPAKHSRGNLFNKKTWNCCGRFEIAKRTTSGRQRTPRII